jgi:VanZ family protein
VESRNAPTRPLVARSSVAGWALVALWTVVILVLSFQPGTEELGRRRFRFDVSSGGHAFFFAILAFLLSSVMARYPQHRAWWWTIVIVTLFGVASELLQALVPLRTPSLVDLIADVGGAAVGCALFIVADRWTDGEPLSQAISAIVPRRPERDVDGSRHASASWRNG